MRARKVGKQQMRQERHGVFSANPKGALQPSARLLEHLRASSWLNELHDGHLRVHRGQAALPAGFRILMGLWCDPVRGQDRGISR